MTTKETVAKQEALPRHTTLKMSRIDIYNQQSNKAKYKLTINLNNFHLSLKEKQREYMGARTSI